MLYRAKSEQGTPVEAFLKDYKWHTGLEIETVELDSPAGSALAKLHDIVDYPAVLVLREDSSPVQVWQGMQLPPIQEVEHAARA